jgi:hypothetical protein
MKRLVRRLLLVLAATAPAVIAFNACDNIPHLPGLQNELDNRLGSPVSLIGTGSGGATTGVGTGGTGGTGGASAVGAAQSPCDCAAAINAPIATCKDCEMTTCLSAFTTCENAAANACSDGIDCVANSSNVPAAIAACLAQNTVYATFIQCLFTECASECGWTSPISQAVCSGSDAGTD